MAGEPRSDADGGGEFPRVHNPPAGSAVSSPFLRGAAPWIRRGPFVVDLRRLGSVRLTFDAVNAGVDPVAAFEPDDVTFVVRYRSEIGRIAIGRSLAAALLGGILGAGHTLLAGPLGRAERGVLAPVLAEVLRALGSPWQMSLHDASPLARDRAVMLMLNAEALGMTAPVRLEIPRTWIDVPNAVAPEQAPSLITTAIVELATTQLRAREWISVQPGDGVVFAGAPVPPALQSWPVRLRVGVHAAPAALDTDGRIRLLDGFRPVPIASGRILGKNQERMDENGKVPGGTVVDPTLVLAAAPIEIVAELGRLVVRGDEVLSLARGGVLSFPGPRATAISLRVGDEIWARGELVDIDGELAVRITELTERQAPRQPPPRQG